MRKSIQNLAQSIQHRPDPPGGDLESAPVVSWRRRGIIAAGWIAALAICLGIGYVVRSGGAPRFDDPVRGWVHGHASAQLTAIMRGFSLIGEPRVLVTLGVIAVLWLVRVGRPRTAILFGATVAGAEMLDQAAKLVFHRARPDAFFGLAEPMGYSYPSGHALVSCTFFGTLAAIASRRTSNRALRWLYFATAAAVTLAIGYSRIYLGVHYPSDVVGGYAASLVWVLSVAWVRRVPPFDWRKPRGPAR